MVSIIIPTYNRSATLQKSIDSVLNQTYRDIEVIIIDDCSTDNTSSVIQSYSDDRLLYYRLDNNSGACFARNVGIALASGDYIAFQDSDDVWLPNKLEMQMDVFDRYHPDVVFCKLIQKRNGRVVQIPQHINEGFIEKEPNLFDIGTQTLVFKKEIIKNALFDVDMPRFQELELLIRINKHHSIYCLDQGLVEYSINDDSISNNPQKMYEACVLLLKKHPLLLSNKAFINSMSNNLIYCASIAKKRGDDYKHYLRLSKSCNNNMKQATKRLLVEINLFLPLIKLKQVIKS